MPTPTNPASVGGGGARRAGLSCQARCRSHEMPPPRSPWKQTLKATGELLFAGSGHRQTLSFLRNLRQDGLGLLCAVSTALQFSPHLGLSERMWSCSAATPLLLPGRPLPSAPDLHPTPTAGARPWRFWSEQLQRLTVAGSSKVRRIQVSCDQCEQRQHYLGPAMCFRLLEKPCWSGDSRFLTTGS